MSKRLACFLVALVLAGVAAGWAVSWGRDRMAAPGPSMDAATVVFAKGESLMDIARHLKEANVIDHVWLFLAEAELSGRAPLLAGEYAFPAHASMAVVLDMMRRGQVVVHKLVVAEGLTSRQIQREMQRADGLSGDLSSFPADGQILPKTYFYYRGDNREAMVVRMKRAMAEALDEVWQKRDKAPGLPASKGDAVILASIVEKETALPAERPHVAAVFINRLKQGMKLQSDPTTIYAVSQGEGTIERALTREDLAIDSPFNTYVAPGLPPAPICNPGRASLEAVLHPASSDDLYFVADGGGGHVFAKTLADHNRNVAKARGQQGPSSSVAAPPPAAGISHPRRR